MSIVDRMCIRFASALYGAKGEEGQGLAEYGLILALIAVVCIAALTLLGTNVSDKLNTVASAI